ncbi:hypothetical protein GGI35DRAFT_88476 [Trichoderma velutinum]
MSPPVSIRVDQAALELRAPAGGWNPPLPIAPITNILLHSGLDMGVKLLVPAEAEGCDSIETHLLSPSKCFSLYAAMLICGEEEQSTKLHIVALASMTQIVVVSSQTPPPSQTCSVSSYSTVLVHAINMRSVSPLKRRIVRLGGQQSRGTSLHPQNIIAEEEGAPWSSGARETTRRQIK